MKFRYPIIYIISSIALIAFLVGCVTPKSDQKVITVSIQPLEGLVKQIINNDYQVTTLLPSGSTPENYSPTPNQLINIEDSEFVFFVGTLDFEDTIARRLAGRDINIVNTGKNAEIVTGECAHNHSVGNVHNHGIDPHIWLSLVELERIVDNIGNAICTAYPDSVRYRTNFEQLIGKIRAANERYSVQFEPHRGDSFVIYHPALTYFARDYGLVQMSVEQEGKAPTPTAIAELAKGVENSHINHLIYQSEYPIDVVKPVADILGLTLLEINPLSKDILVEIEMIANTLLTSEHGTKGVD